MAGETFLSREGYENLRSKVQKLKERRQELAGEIQEAAEKGDLKENAEYHAAKEEQQKVQQRINEAEMTLRSAQILEESGIKTGEVRIGAKVSLKDIKHNEDVSYILVDSAEADFSLGKISVQSPVAEALLGHKEGDEVRVDLPAGPITYKILKVSRSV